MFLAIWFHDAVYDPKRQDNELKSSQLWALKMAPFLPNEAIKWGKMAILATIAHYPNSDPDIQLFLDLDLASLGESWETFQTNTEHIRQEYSHVSDDDFRKGRADFLTEFLKRPRLYGTEYWHNRLEEQARDNIKKAIKCLTE
jgi:predicted metal-dependent HD superfamily phosphohydrolase